MEITQCRSCNSQKLTQFLDLGDQYISDFREDDKKPSKYPLTVVICDDCKLVQLNFNTPRHEMYHKNYGFKSGISDSIKADLDDVVTSTFQYYNNPRKWLDIACNDGTLLSFVPKDIYRVGVDPVGFLAEEAKQHADKIVNDFFDWRLFADYSGSNGEVKFEKFDVVTSISCFYDMPNSADFVREVLAVLEDRGVWAIQQNYLLTTLQLNAVDNFCHEHLEYYTLLSLESLLERHGLEVIDLSTSMVNGGSLRTIVARKGKYPVQDSVERQRTIERDYGLHTMEPYLRFAQLVRGNLDHLKEFVTNLHDEGKSIYILAASTRGATIWQSAGIDSGLVDFAVERNPAKVGKYFSAIGVPIISEEEARERKPDYMIIGPWFFADEIKAREAEYVKNGGHLIVPLPHLEII